MLAFSTELTCLYETLLAQHIVLRVHRPHYMKWLRYYLYLNFCPKYALEPRDRQSFPAFNEKLRVKYQSDFQRKQPHHGLSLL
jgi:hypothetical protein